MPEGAKEAYRYLDAAADALERSWPTGETIDPMELHAAVGRILMYLRAEARTPLNAECRTLADGSMERFVLGEGWSRLPR